MRSFARFPAGLKRQIDVGADTGTPVDNQDIKCPSNSTAKSSSSLSPSTGPQLTPADIEKLKEAQRNNKTSE
jgi:hypothetical protein